MILSEEVHRVKNFGVILAQKPFVQHFCALNPAKIFRLDDGAEIILRNDVRANQKVVYELATIKPSIGFLILNSRQNFERSDNF